MNEMSHGFLINAKFENAKYFCTPYIVLGLLERKLQILEGMFYEYFMFQRLKLCHKIVHAI